jgi:HAE1 family hydrophobic/amphiphilic exporter-1
MTGTGSVITLQDIATVSEAADEASSLSRYNGQDNVSISIQNKSSYGTVNVCKEVSKKLDKIQEENPAISFDVTYNASDAIESSLSSVAQTLVLGVLLTMLVLFIFFGDFKASLIVGMSMPISLFVTLILMSAMGFSMNIVTMGALVIAIGMMVDSSIVVIESCFRRQEKGFDFKEAAYEGTREVTASIIASTITTIVVYLPLATMDGLSGQLFSQLGFTIVFAMLASLIAAMMLVPLFYYIIKPVPKDNLPIDKLLAKVHTGYRKLLHRILNKRKTVVFVSIALVVISILLAATLNMELIPSSDEGMVEVALDFRSGTTLETENEAIKIWEEIAAADENVQSYTVSVGSGASSMSTSSGAASLTATLKKDRTLTTAQMVDKWNELAAGMTNMDVTVSSTGSSMSSMMSSDSYEVDLQGSDLESLKAAAEDLMAELEKVDGVVKVESSMSNPSVIAKIEVDPLKAMQYGLTPIQIGMTVNNVISGVSPLTITNAGSEYEVRLEYPEGQFDDLNQILDLDISTSFGTTVPLRDIAEIKYEESQESITKQDGLYLASLTCTLNSEKIYAAESDIDEITEKTVYPDGVAPAESMMNEMMVEEFTALVKAILTAVFLVFLVMAMQFESPRFSFMVMLCIPFSLVGSFLLLFITRSTISMVSLMGFLMLMGIVVNNGILFVDSTNQFKKEMPVEDALVETGIIRLRPILMTTLTTILSMLPMGLGLGSGENAKMMQGMALVIIGGLIASTVLTLILIPTFYLIIDKDERAKRKAQRKAQKAQAV